LYLKPKEACRDGTFTSNCRAIAVTIVVIADASRYMVEKVDDENPLNVYDAGFYKRHFNLTVNEWGMFG
jgi:hypothetical protein